MGSKRVGRKAKKSNHGNGFGKVVSGRKRCYIILPKLIYIYGDGKQVAPGLSPSLTPSHQSGEGDMHQNIIISQAAQRSGVA